MTPINWLAEHWLDLLQSIGIVSGLFFTAYSIRKEDVSRKIANLMAVTAHHHAIWREVYEQPELSRVLDPAVPLDRESLCLPRSSFLSPRSSFTWRSSTGSSRPGCSTPWLECGTTSGPFSPSRFRGWFGTESNPSRTQTSLHSSIRAWRSLRKCTALRRIAPPPISDPHCRCSPALQLSEIHLCFALPSPGRSPRAMSQCPAGAEGAACRQLAERQARPSGTDPLAGMPDIPGQFDAPLH